MKKKKKVVEKKKKNKVEKKKKNVKKKKKVKKSEPCRARRWSTCSTLETNGDYFSLTQWFAKGRINSFYPDVCLSRSV